MRIHIKDVRLAKYAYVKNPVRNVTC